VIVTLVPTDPAATVFADQNHFTATVNGAQAMATPLASRVFVMYTFILPAAGDFLPGDVDGNGKVNSTDARLTLQLSVNKITEADLTVPQAADVNHDGSVNSTDARLILQYSVGKIKDWP